MSNVIESTVTPSVGQEPASRAATSAGRVIRAGATLLAGGAAPGEKLSASEVDRVTNLHPCFAAGCQAKNARLHVAVAPRCNISCNYCVRKFDCVNESRPGVASTVLSPEDALTRFEVTRDHLGNLSVVGIAGPGDALANWPKVERTFELIREDDPDVAFCLSTNGLMLPRYADRIVALGVTHVTVTVNAVDPVIGGQMYRHVVFDGVAYEGLAAGRVLLRNQLEGIRKLAAAGVCVKVNTVLVSGVNVQHAVDVARVVRDAGAQFHNVTCMIPVEGSVFEGKKVVDGKTLQRVRKQCARYLKQIRHCHQCRADAVGLLGSDISRTIDRLCRDLAKTKRFAVATRSGARVDAHFGQAARFLVFDSDGSSVKYVEGRDVRPYCQGKAACGQTDSDVFDALRDCQGVLCQMVGPEPIGQLEKLGVHVFHAGYEGSERVRHACAGGGVEAAVLAAYEAVEHEAGRAPVAGGAAAGSGAAPASVAPAAAVAATSAATPAPTPAAPAACSVRELVSA